MKTFLWEQLTACANVLRGVRDGRSMTVLLEEVDATRRPGVQALAFQVMRNLGLALALRSSLAARTPPAQVDAYLCTVLALMCGNGPRPYEDHTLVDQAVEGVKRNRAMAGSANFVNACLRRFLRERKRLLEVAEADPVAKWNHPQWWIAKVSKDYPDHWVEILDANRAQSPMTLRVNARRTSVPAYRQLLLESGIASFAVGESGLQLVEARPVRQLPGFAEGLVSVQDAAAQLAAPILLNRTTSSSPRILDACAAPGGKTSHLLERCTDADVTALDIDAKRCERIEQNLTRLGLRASVMVADAGKPETWWDGVLFDAILLDAPCTASGIVRRHPDVPWLRRETDVDALAVTQGQLLRTLWPLLRPGGCLLYCTCSVFRAEGESQIKAFVAHNTNAFEHPAPGHLLPRKRANGVEGIDNSWGDHDGFFYSLLEKRVVEKHL